MASLSFLDVHGEDSSRFLHQQLSADIQGLEQGQCARAYYCSAKGRALAFFLVHKKSQTAFALLCHAEGLEAIVKRLRMFVLRDAVSIEINAQRLALTDDGLWQSAGFSLSPSDQPSEDARILDAAVEAELAFLPSAAQDAHIPQSLNADLDGSVNFEKGCYPGQEIVARTHYLGKVKRRMFRVKGQNLVAGAPIEHQDKSVGSVVLAAPSQALITLQITAVQHELHCETQALMLEAPRLDIPELKTE